jgi:tetratricopeptide (TPR) repeat protein
MSEEPETITRASGARSVQGDVSRSSTDEARLNEALIATERVVRGLRHASRSHARLGDLLAAVGRRGDAISELVAAKALGQGRAEDYEALAFAAFGLGEHQLAREYYAQVTEMAPRDATAWYNLATSERNVGRFGPAEAACDRAIAYDPQMFQAYLLRSQLRTQRSDCNHVDELIGVLQKNSSSVPAQIFLNYALGKEWDDIGHFDGAFEYFSHGARFRRLNLQYDVAQDTQKIRQIIRAFGSDDLRQRARESSLGPYVFILGLPRSGTTLIERVLTGHPDVRSNGETDNFSTALLQALPDQAGDVFERAALADPARIAAGYAKRAGSGPTGGIVLEKLPLNYLYVGAIHMAMPEARIILVRRDAIDNCFAMYSTLFGAGYPFSYELGELATYYAAYDQLMGHWKTQISNQILEVSYEAFVENPASLGPTIAEHVGLDWTANMLKIEDNPTASATASAVQIRRPIYKTAAGRWRNYAKHLHPLVHALDAAGVVHQATD